MDETHFKTCGNLPWQCFSCQMIRLANGLHSGRYSEPNTTESHTDTIGTLQGVTPAYLKLLIGRDHPEFSTMRQQDALEFYEYLIKLVERKERGTSQDPIDEFRFRLQQKLHCERCGGVRRSSFVTTSISISLPMDENQMQKSISLDGTDGTTERLPTISLYDCLEDFVREELVDFRCPSCKTETKAKK